MVNAARQGADGTENAPQNENAARRRAGTDGSARSSASGPGDSSPRSAAASAPSSGAGSRAGSGTAEHSDAGATTGQETSRSRELAVVSWTALLVAVLLTVWEAISSLHLGGIDPAADPSAWNSFYPVSLFVSLVLGLAAAVLGTVGISQRRRPKWPGLAGLAVGLYAFIGAVFAWVGGLMDTGSSL